MLDHAAVNVSDFRRRGLLLEGARSTRLLARLREGGFMGFADSAACAFGVVRRDPAGGAHVAFKCDDHAQVDAFYEAAIAAGGKDNGPPGIRAHYHENYYGAFVHDADGNNIEAVCQAPM